MEEVSEYIGKKSGVDVELMRSEGERAELKEQGAAMAQEMAQQEQAPA
jgi:hypothetical protein